MTCASISCLAIFKFTLLGLVQNPQLPAEFFGHVGVETRFFLSEPVAPEQPRLFNISASFEPQFEVTLSNRVAFRATGFIRLDENDMQRSHFDARDAHLQLDANALTIKLGINTVFWGVTESRHLVNIANQTDYLEALDGDMKLGQLMSMFSYDTNGLGLFDVLVMSWFRPQLYPSSMGRPGIPVPVLDESPVFATGLARWNVDVALRWSNSIGVFDWAISYFHGTSREPQFIPSGATSGLAVRPHYDLIDQVGLEFQWSEGDWLWKGEGMIRGGQGPLFAATTVGFEYTTYGIFGSTVDAGLLLEYNYDGRDNLTFTFHDNDAFGGLRISPNDAQGSEILAGVLADVKTGATMATVETSRRFGERWRIALVGRGFRVRDKGDLLFWFRRDHYLQSTLEFHF